MSDWPHCHLGEVLEISKERIEPLAHPTRDFNYVGLEHIERHTGRLLAHGPTRGSEIRSTKNVFHKNEILFGKLRPNLNKVHLTTNDGICSTDIYVMRSRNGRISPAWASYFLRSPKTLHYVTNAMAGANLPRIGHEALLSLLIPVPPLAEQERIVKLLDEADAIRKLRARADQRTADLIPALFAEMFGDPVTNPMGWPLAQLGDIGGRGQYGLNAAATRDTSGVRFIRITDIGSDGRLSRVSPAYVADSPKDLEPYVLATGDLLIARSGATAGKSYMHRSLPEKCVFAGYLIRFRIDETAALPAHVFSFLQTQAYWSQLNGHKRAVAQPNVNAKQLSSLSFPLPPLAQQREFVDRLELVQSFRTTQQSSDRTLSAGFEVMLHQAFSSSSSRRANNELERFDGFS